MVNNPPPFPIWIADLTVRGSICAAHIRFRRAWVAQGNSLEDLAFRAAAGVWGSWIGLFLNVLCLIAQFYIAVWPIGGLPTAQNFFESYLAAPIVLALFLGWKIYHNTSYVRTMDIDLQSGRRDLNLRELREQEAVERANWGPVKRYSSNLLHLN
jgi:amino acid transporter